MRSVLVVISYYDGRPGRHLIELLRSMRFVPAGWPYQVRVMVNQVRPAPLSLPADLGDVEVHYRHNRGFNIGAWEAGWRTEPAYDGYLFLQDECQIVREGWVAAFVHKAVGKNVGLVGECLSPNWDAPWETLALLTQGDQLPEHCVEGKPAERVRCYLHFLRTHGIAPGLKGDHLQSVVLFARREVLVAINGFPVGRNYGEAIASEIGISKKVQALGMSIREVGPDPFTFIQHPQWLHRRREAVRDLCDLPLV